MVTFDYPIPKLKASWESLSDVDEKRIERAKNAISIARAEVFSAYRSLIKSYGRDPSKRRPSSERMRALLKRGELELHPAVKAYAIVSAASGVVLSGFDERKLSGEIRYGTRQGEVELLDGSILELTGKELVLMDDEKPLSVVPYMDTKYALIDDETRNAIFVPHIVSGVPPALALWSLRRLKEILESMGARAVIEL